jgi:aconitate hydratase
MNSFQARATLSMAGKELTVYRLKTLVDQGHRLDRLPFSLRILLENLLRCEGNGTVAKGDVEALLKWDAKADPSHEIAFMPARVLLQDFTGVPCVVDLAAMRDAMAELGGDPGKINPLQPVELVIDHSVQVDAYGSEAALLINRDLEFERNHERYQFLKWGQSALQNFKVVPPNTGICHQVNLEYLSRVVFVNDEGVAYPDTLVGTDSHTTMVNGLGVLGWGVGGIEAEAAMLGQPISMLIPQVIGFRLTGKLREGSTSTDMVLRVTEMLRQKGVVGKFVEFFGEGMLSLPLADRATIANMAPEYGATCGIFPVDAVTLRYLRLTGRSEEQIQLVEAYMREQGMFFDENTPEAEYTDVLELDLASVEPAVAGPKRPQDRIPLGLARESLHTAFPALKDDSGSTAVMTDTSALTHGSVVIAAITSCTNTSNPSVMVAAGLLARNAAAHGLQPKPWVKTSLAPGSRVVTEYLKKANLLDDLEQIGFNVVGYGCTTCIGNSGPLPEWVSQKVQEEELIVCSVLSGNRNFEGRVQQEVKANYLMSPPLVVAYALAGTLETNLQNDPLGVDREGNPVYLRDIWPSQEEVASVIEQSVSRELFLSSYEDVFKGDEKWAEIDGGSGDRFRWDANSTYVKHPPYFTDMTSYPPREVQDLNAMKVLALLGDSITTDHISPAGSIKANSPAGQWLQEHGVAPKDFNSYGARRGHDEVMVRGTFANIRLRNLLAPGTEGGFTVHHPTGEVMTIFEAAERYHATETKLLVIAGKEYGTGSSRDWAAKGTFLLGVKAVLAESFERIHRSNLIGMGVLPLQFLPGESAASLGLEGTEEYSLLDLSYEADRQFRDGKKLPMRATVANGDVKTFEVLVRIDTPKELEYYRHGGILQYVLRQLLAS